MTKTNDVFGIRTELILSYVARDEVDERFKDALQGDHHIVVYGSSKQGKTSLRQKHLKPGDCVIVRCGPRMKVETLYQSILRQAGARIQTMQSSTVGASASAKGSVGFKALIPWFGGGEATAEVGAEASAEQELTSEFIAHDYGDAQSIAELLGALKFKKWVVLENYHYLPDETQRAIAFDLKTFHEVGIRFLILGIWKEANLLITHNGDLQDRLVEIPVEPWNNASFDELAATGSRLLNIAIHPRVLSQFKGNAYGNVGLFQEFLKHFCVESGVTETQAALQTFDSQDAVNRTIATKLESQQSALLKNLQGISAKSRIRRGEQERPLLLPYYLVQVVIHQDVNRLSEGIDRGHLLTLLREAHHREDKDTIRVNDVTNLLLKLPLYQSEMSPPLLYYDNNSKRLRVVDSRIFFVLANADRNGLAAEIPMPEMADDNDAQLPLLVAHPDDSDGVQEKEDIVAVGGEPGDLG